MITNKGCKKIIALFYKDKAARLHLREIARRAGLHEPSTSRFLNGLEKESILTSEKDGNLKKYSLMKNKSVYLFLALFDIERFEQLPSFRKRAINYYLKELEEKPVFVILFGSTAKGTLRRNSDLDLLLITNRLISAKKAEAEAEALTSIKISTFQVTFSKFQKELKLKEEPVIQSALFSGYPIYNHIAYYEELNDERI
ncbi:MAG: nucleotidyltransferase domain-containing protein [Nanoarchaeota archaeon]